MLLKFVMTPRWKKLVRDVDLARARVAMMVLAIAVGVFAVASIVSAYTLLSREVSKNYLNTFPASATLEVRDMDESSLAQVRQLPRIAAAEMRTSFTAKMKMASGKTLPVTVFVVPDFSHMKLTRILPASGTFVPQLGEVVLEREALKLIQAQLGTDLVIQSQQIPNARLRIVGTVHDASLAPAWQEQSVYAYISEATLKHLHPEAQLDALKILVADDAGRVSFDSALIDTTVAQVAVWLQSNGKQLNAINIPPAGKHPHQGQMNDVLRLFLAFSVTALLLSSILTATMINALLAQQVKQIGVMKAIGAGSWAIARLYVVFVAVLGGVATMLGMPLGIWSGRALASVGTQLFNIDLTSNAIPLWVYATTLVSGIALPMLCAAFPIYRATQMTVRAAIGNVGVVNHVRSNTWLNGVLRPLSWLDRSLILALRNSFRRRGRLLMNLILLGTAGALFIGTLSVKNAWEENLRIAARDRPYDIETVLTQAQPEQEVRPLLAAIDGVRFVEAWDEQSVSRARADGLSVSRTYPDGGHGKLALIAVPDQSQLLGLTMLQGRWLRSASADESEAAGDGVVLNSAAYRYFGEVPIGSRIAIAVKGQNIELPVVGVARELLTGAHVYVNQATYQHYVQEAGRSQVYRIVLSQHDEASITRAAAAIEAQLALAHIDVKLNITETIKGAALDAHTMVLIVVLLLMAGLMAMVGALGLASSMGTSVIERTREFGMMRTIGGRSSIILRNLIGEGIFVGILSAGLAMLLSLPVGLVLGAINTGLNAGLDLPIVFAPQASLMWLVGILLISVLASALPAMRAARLTVRETLACV